MLKRRSFTLVAILAFVLAASVALAGNKELMSNKMAKNDLKRQLVEWVIGLKVKSYSEMGLTEDPKYDVKTKAVAVIKGIKVDKQIYDKDKDVALVFGHIDLGDVKNVLGERIAYKNVTVNGFGFGSMTEESRRPLRALRAAMLNAYDELASTLVGEKVLSKSESENFILTKDVNRSKVLAAIAGAHIPDIDLNAANRGWGWEENGNAFVKLRLDARTAKDILGNNIIYKGDAGVIEVVGRGAQVDELNPDGPSMVKKSGDKVKYQSLDIPGLGGPASPDKLKGGAENRQP